jgi:hypothetical protein
MRYKNNTNGIVYYGGYSIAPTEEISFDTYIPAAVGLTLIDESGAPEVLLDSGSFALSTGASRSSADIDIAGDIEIVVICSSGKIELRHNVATNKALSVENAVYTDVASTEMCRRIVIKAVEDATGSYAIKKVK